MLRIAANLTSVAAEGQPARRDSATVAIEEAAPWASPYEERAASRPRITPGPN